MNFTIEGGRVRYLRTHLQLTQSQFAEKLGLKQPHISEVEKGITGVSLDALRKMYLAFGYNPIFHLIGNGNVIIENSDSGKSSVAMRKEPELYNSADNRKELNNLLEQVEILKNTIETLSNKNEQLTDKYFKLNEKHIKLSEKHIRFSEKYSNLVEKEKFLP